MITIAQMSRLPSVIIIISIAFYISSDFIKWPQTIFTVTDSTFESIVFCLYEFNIEQCCQSCCNPNGWLSERDRQSYSSNSMFRTLKTIHQSISTWCDFAKDWWSSFGVVSAFQMKRKRISVVSSLRKLIELSSLTLCESECCENYGSSLLKANDHHNGFPTAFRLDGQSISWPAKSNDFDDIRARHWNGFYFHFSFLLEIAHHNRPVAMLIHWNFFSLPFFGIISVFFFSVTSDVWRMTRVSSEQRNEFKMTVPSISTFKCVV